MRRALFLPPLAPALWWAVLWSLDLSRRSDTIHLPVAEPVSFVIFYLVFLVLNVLLVVPFVLATLAVTRHPAAGLLVAIAVAAAAAEVMLRADLFYRAVSILDGDALIFVAGPMALLGLGTFHFLRLRWIERAEALLADG